MKYVDTVPELKTAREGQTEAVCLRVKNGPWQVWIPGSDRPRPMPNGGYPEPRYTNK